SSTELPLLTPNQARVVIAVSALILLLIQAALMLYMRNGLVPPGLGDRYTEANVVRAADYFVHEGFAKTVGLPNVVWSPRFPDAGTVAEPESLGLTNGVYLHYPPAPDLIAGVMAKLVGTERVWIWRLPCVALNLVAMVILARVLIQVMGIDRAAIMIAALVATPMMWTFMSGLHFQGYASALWLFEFAVLLRAYWIDGGLSRTQMGLLALLGFGQGWLSFDFVFLVFLLPLPLWLMRRAEGATLNRASLLLAMLASLAGFCVAHLLHFIQVAVYLGGLHQAIADYRSIAGFRAHGNDQAPHIVWIARAIAGYAFRTLGPNVHFLVWFPIVFGLAALTLLLRRLEFQVGPAPRTRWIWQVPWSYVIPLLAALGVGGAWLVVMPQHAAIHYHFVGRHLFPFYFCCLFMLIRCLTRQPVDESRPLELPEPEAAVQAV
ncbi:MAG TPA: hypothetical protein VH518_05185, partial [Tepidisphaeraceae bacterium]